MKNSAKKPKKSDQKQQREDRLAAALRANLRRRKTDLNKADPLPENQKLEKPNG